MSFLRISSIFVSEFMADNRDQFRCPHCNHMYCDELELLNANELHSMNCEACNKPFFMAFVECDNCDFDIIETSIYIINIDLLKNAPCPYCTANLSYRTDKCD